MKNIHQQRALRRDFGNQIIILPRIKNYLNHCKRTRSMLAKNLQHKTYSSSGLIQISYEIYPTEQLMQIQSIRVAIDVSHYMDNIEHS